MTVRKIDLKAMQDEFQSHTGKYCSRYMDAIASSLGYVYVADWKWDYSKSKLVRIYQVKTGMITKDFKSAKDAGQWLEGTIQDINNFAQN